MGDIIEDHTEKKKKDWYQILKSNVKSLGFNKEAIKNYFKLENNMTWPVPKWFWHSKKDVLGRVCGQRDILEGYWNSVDERREIICYLCIAVQ